MPAPRKCPPVPAHRMSLSAPLLVPSSSPVPPLVPSSSPAPPLVPSSSPASPLVPSALPEHPQEPALPERPLTYDFPNNFFLGGHIAMAGVAGPRAKATESPNPPWPPESPDPPWLPEIPDPPWLPEPP